MDDQVTIELLLQLLADRPLQPDWRDEFSVDRFAGQYCQWADRIDRVLSKTDVQHKNWSLPV